MVTTTHEAFIARVAYLARQSPDLTLADLESLTPLSSCTAQAMRACEA